MANYKRRLFVVLSAAVFWGALVLWLAFHAHYLSTLGGNQRVMVVLCCLGIVPIFFYPWVAKRAPSIRVNLTLMGAYVVLTSIRGIAIFAFGVDNNWTDGMGYLRQALLLSALVFSIWQAMKNRREKKMDRSS
jgi:uncharacterized membrane protein